ncbi:unnamed protein product, partial [Musa hybrid cultivar]
MAFLRKFFTTAEAIDVTGRPRNENGILKIRTHALNAPVKLSPYSQPLQLRRVPWREPAAAAEFSSVELLSLRHFPRRTVDAAASSPSANGTTPGISLLLLLLLLLRRRTIPSPPSSSLFPLSSQLSRFPDTILLLPSPPSSLFHPFIAAPRPSSPIPSPPPLHHSPRPLFSYSDPNGPLSVFLLRTRQPPLHYLAPAPTAPISLLYTPLRPLYTSSPPLSYS